MIFRILQPTRKATQTRKKTNIVYKTENIHKIPKNNIKSHNKGQEKGETTKQKREKTGKTHEKQQ